MQFLTPENDLVMIYEGNNGVYFCHRMQRDSCVSAVLPRLFERVESLPDSCYYDEMVRLFPEYKNEKQLSEKQIQELLLEECGDRLIDGRTGILAVDEYLGIKVEEDYKLPDGLSPKEFNLQRFYDFGCEQFLRQREWCQDKGGVEQAYMWAWQNLHFKNYNEEDALQQLSGVFQNLKQLNPQLERLQINERSIRTLHNVIDGVVYGFPVADIELFSNGQEKEVCFSKKQRPRMERELEENGLPKMDLPWIASTETIVEMGKKYRAKQNIINLEKLPNEQGKTSV